MKFSGKENEATSGPRYPTPGVKSFYHKKYLENSGAEKPSGFVPGVLVVSTTSNIVLNEESAYEIYFGLGFLDGEGISVDATGKKITFSTKGSYKIELFGEAILFSEANVVLKYHSETLSDDFLSFSTIKIPRQANVLNIAGVSTILPMESNQVISVRLIPDPKESIMLLEGARLMIHRVA